MRTFLALALLAAPADDFRLEGVPTQGGLVTGEAPAGAVSAVLRTPGAADVSVTLDRGRFLVGFDRDAPANAELVARFADGRELRRPVVVAPRAWRIERVDAPLRAGRTSAEFEAVRPGELQRIAAARAARTEATGWRERFRWPATGRVSGLFGSQRVYQGVPGSYHSGVDVALPTGAPVVAPAGGVVVLAADPARPFTLEGNLLLIDHGGGLSSAFLHLSRIHVREGQRVEAGQLVGEVGRSGRATGPHLHWGLRWRDARLDPLLVAGPMPR
ncbi:M23 family metallopeptidase [Sphingomonas lenta]|uniref:Peptidase n=1 Tax=Sphingomonas lenta TaxID=1141887 RepID=A0A2A2SD68_9SPHN|nr:M23 family metallopeptidase [Sphingomonas lenta]PAX07188.1 peptidase [Sphingomonas lenta]